ncbi:gamma-glutamyltranspeptidase / glutathione hydrolase [Prosthecobacter debontii]|uniref:Glutathione hydrolase proenzyme n=1 Tax=Prosthecobacter debontii TaxID=48467 RepID=A0A1T4WK70_9BACT|nr:gamma-glutamyltransferase [Prosthecobacter debontii]SKA77031.1 gamma-glutamyltranspeptidase / glutathione hydrolase [Prosthecobacter debontii]
MIVLLPFACGLGYSSIAQTAPPEAEAGFSKFAVATVHPLASDAAHAAYARGGNAVDAAVAAALTLGVVDGHNSGIGGGCFLVIRAADGSLTAIDGRETAPAKAHRDMYLIGGKLDDEASKTGALAPAVPGALRAYELALKKHGRLSLADLLRPAADLAEKGFPIDEVYARKLKATAEKLRRFPSSAALFLKPDGSPWQEGETLVQTDLAKTYRALADQGLDWFYGGPFAQQTEAWMKENGGLLSTADFSGYRAIEREPIRASYRGYDLVCMPPPSSGGVHVAQILNILEQFPVRHFKASSRIHVVTEAMKLAFADRAHWLGDPDFVPVPRGLVTQEYARELAAKIDLDHTTAVPAHGMPPHWEGDVFGKHTTHLCTADAEGNWVALNQTINTAFGSKVVIPGTGVLLNNEMDDFAVQPGVPNAFKLVGAEANAIAPGKRPLSSMSPTLVFKDGQPILTVGAAGGPTIITQTLLLISHVIDDGMGPNAALKEPRFHHQWNPDELKIESQVPAEVLQQLEQMGHQLAPSPSFGACQAILKDTQRNLLIPAHDPRVPGKASGQ